jgi:hypothetical protein
VNETTAADTAEREWRDWWDALPDDVRQKITDYEASIGAKLTWNHRYLLVTPPPDSDTVT